MKWFRLLLTSALGFGFGGASAQAAMSYWDTNGPAPGASDTPTGSWDTNQFWSASADGTAFTSAWVDGDTAVFSAGSDATNAYTVTLEGGIQAGGLTFEEGLATITNGVITMTNEFEFPILTQTNAIIASALQDYYGTCGIRKTGPGTLMLSGYNSYGPVGCTNTIAEGVLIFSNYSGMGSSPLFVIVSNGASLQFGAGASMGCPLALMGTGVDNSGAFRFYHHVFEDVPFAWTGGAELWTNASIVLAGKSKWTWGRPHNIQGRSGNYDLTIGGDGPTIRLNMDQPYNASVDLGTGVFTKEGSCMLQLENPCYCSAFRFNGGSIYPRNISYIGQGSISVGPAPGITFRALFQNCGLNQPMVLAAGASLGFDCRSNGVSFAPYSFTCGGVLSGEGGVNLQGGGQVVFTAANTYSGTTTLIGNPQQFSGAGTLILTGHGSITNSAVIDVQSNATFNVSGVASEFVLAAAQTLKGDGLVVGNVTAEGTLSPGGSIGNLTFDTNLTLTAGANLLIEVDKSASPANDLITVLGTLSSTSTGTVTVVNLGATPLAPSDTFPIFSQPVPNGQALQVVSAGGGVVWSNRLADDGSIVVVSVPPSTPPPTNLTIVAAGPATFRLRAQGGANLPYAFYGYTNVTTPLTTWWRLGTVFADAGGVIQFVDALATNKQRFYRLASVPAAPPKVPATNLTIAAFAPAGFTLRAAGGAHLTYNVYATTNVTTPLGNWVLIGNPVADAGGVIQFEDTQPGNRQRFYRFGQ